MLLYSNTPNGGIWVLNNTNYDTNYNLYIYTLNNGTSYHWENTNLPPVHFSYNCSFCPIGKSFSMSAYNNFNYIVSMCQNQLCFIKLDSNGIPIRAEGYWYNMFNVLDTDMDNGLIAIMNQVTIDTFYTAICTLESEECYYLNLYYKFTSDHFGQVIFKTNETANGCWDM